MITGLACLNIWEQSRASRLNRIEAVMFRIFHQRTINAIVNIDF